MQVYDSVDSIRWSRPKGRLYILAKRGSRDLRKLLWMPKPLLPTFTNLTAENILLAISYYPIFNLICLTTIAPPIP
jgi:hypothetical protein